MNRNPDVLAFGAFYATCGPLETPTNLGPNFGAFDVSKLLTPALAPGDGGIEAATASPGCPGRHGTSFQILSNFALLNHYIIHNCIKSSTIDTGSWSSDNPYYYCYYYYYCASPEVALGFPLIVELCLGRERETWLEARKSS